MDIAVYFVSVFHDSVIAPESAKGLYEGGTLDLTIWEDIAAPFWRISVRPGATDEADVAAMRSRVQKHAVQQWMVKTEDENNGHDHPM